MGKERILPEKVYGEKQVDLVLTKLLYTRTLTNLYSKIIFTHDCVV